MTGALLLLLRNGVGEAVEVIGLVVGGATVAEAKEANGGAEEVGEKAEAAGMGEEEARVEEGGRGGDAREGEVLAGAEVAERRTIRTRIGQRLLQLKSPARMRVLSILQLISLRMRVVSPSEPPPC